MRGFSVKSNPQVTKSTSRLNEILLTAKIRIKDYKLGINSEVNLTRVTRCREMQFMDRNFGYKSFSFKKNEIYRVTLD